MTHADINDLEIIGYTFEVNGRKKGISAHYDKDADAVIFPRVAFEYVAKLLGGERVEVTE